ncbi:hypothetical protein DAPPUDRAFT_256246 [Daphnia pulex]|uniref:Uncharacterized protein n=1 Tax=Daphnia pulex TaxID=6669 RepID=E9HB79_DAPPU|nr:hypothetical protein DAPPUDRAFT_256246 [Daphnia pulex]|eukprot:EFX71056.1 hypothetical protein DAPPUDRAFT_256246 [Daphnia pulex]
MDILGPFPVSKLGNRNPATPWSDPELDDGLGKMLRSMQEILEAKRIIYFRWMKSAERTQMGYRWWTASREDRGYEEWMLGNLQHAFAEVDGRSQAVQDHHKRYYDQKRRKADIYEAGQLFLLRSFFTVSGRYPAYLRDVTHGGVRTRIERMEAETGGSGADGAEIVGLQMGRKEMASSSRKGGGHLQMDVKVWKHAVEAY